MLFSANVVDTTAIQAFRRKTPSADAVPGLRSARTATCALFSPGLIPRPQLNRELLVACWDDETSLDRFLATDPTGQAFGAGWGVRMKLFRSVGVWPGLDDDMAAIAAETPEPASGPSIALTIGTAYLRTAVPFLRVSGNLEEQFLAAPNTIWGTALTNLPQLLVGTFTIWDHANDAAQYMRTGAHAAAMKEHFDPKKDPTGHTFVTGGGFFGFQPISTTGSLDGKNPIPASLTVG